MKKASLFYAAIAALSLTACNNNGGNTTAEKPKQFPKPGTLIASSDMQVVTNDPVEKLNKFTFAIKVIADSNITSGEYDVDADYGPNFAEGHLAMPKGGEHLVPVIRKSSEPNTFIIGFKLPNDTTFYDYYQVTGNRTTMKMQYIKAYTF